MKKVVKWSDTGRGRNYSARIMIGDHLMLPAAGKRFQDGATYDVNGDEGNAGTMATYWSSEPADTKEHAYAFEIRGNSDKGIVRKIKHEALPIKCIKK